MQAIPHDADMLLLGYTIMDGLAERASDPKFTQVYYCNGTFAYLLTRKGTLALLPRLLPLQTHIDNQINLSLVAAPLTLKSYGCEPNLFGHDFTVYSDVYEPVADTARADATPKAYLMRVVNGWPALAQDCVQGSSVEGMRRDTSASLRYHASTGLAPGDSSKTGSENLSLHAPMPWIDDALACDGYTR